MTVSGRAVETPLAPRCRLTGLGWCLLALVPPLGVTWFLPASSPQPYGAALAAGLLVALALAAWWAPRSLRCVAGEWVLPRSAHALAATTTGARLSAEHGAPPLTLLAWEPMKQGFEVAARLIGLEAARASRSNSAAQLSWVVRFPRRGWQRLPGLTACTVQPFGLFTATRSIGAPRELLVFPAVGQLRRVFEAHWQWWLESRPHLTPSGHEELAHLRPYRPGDHPHSLHWKASARRRSLLVMERHSPGPRRLALVVDTTAGAPLWKIERLISIAATLVEYFCAKGWSLTLHGLFATEGLQAGREGLLEALALAGMQAGRISDVIPVGGATIVLTLHPLAETPPDAFVLTLAECEQLIAWPGGLH